MKKKLLLCPICPILVSVWILNYKCPSLILKFNRGLIETALYNGIHASTQPTTIIRRIRRFFSLLYIYNRFNCQHLNKKTNVTNRKKRKSGGNILQLQHPFMLNLYYQIFKKAVVQRKNVVILICTLNGPCIIS